MQDNIKASVIGSFIGDAMALGVHWVYDPEEISKKYGIVNTYIKPELVEYHLGKEAGEFTHYGDQAFELLFSVSTSNEFDADNFMSRWRAMFKADYKGYFDKATLKTLEQFGECESYTECVSNSSELGGVSRIAPLLMIYPHDLEGFRNAAVEQTRLTHNNPLTLETAAFFAETVYKVLHGKSPADAMRSIIENGSEDFPHILALIEAGLNSIAQPTKKAINDFGMGCDVNGALQSTVHTIAKYEDDFSNAIIENVMAGGDSAARGMIIGMVIGARSGMNSIPLGWFEGLKCHKELEGLVNQTLHKHYYDEPGEASL